jgi:predicted dehydrogenase
MGERYARIYQQLPQAELVAVCDTNVSRLRQVSEQLGVRAYESFDDLLAKEPRVEAVVITTPEAGHLEPATAAARCGKHLLIEKPLAHDAISGRAIVDAAQAAGVTLMVAHLQRFDPRYGLLKDAVQNGELGEIIHIYIRLSAPLSEAYRLGGRTSVVHYLGVHNVDTLLWITGQRVKRIYARGVQKSLQDLGIADCVLATLTFENDALAVIENSWVLPDDCGRPAYALCQIVGTKGSAEVMEYEQGLALFAPHRVSYPDSVYFTVARGQWFGALRDEAAHFVDSLAAGVPPLVNGEDGLHAVMVCDGIMRSIEEGRELVGTWPP